MPGSGRCDSLSDTNMVGSTKAHHSMQEVEVSGHPVYYRHRTHTCPALSVKNVVSAVMYDTKTCGLTWSWIANVWFMVIGLSSRGCLVTGGVFHYTKDPC